MKETTRAKAFLLSRPLKFGDREQIDAVKIIEQEQKTPEYINGPAITCAACGKVIGLDEFPFCDDCNALLSEGE